MITHDLINNVTEVPEIVKVILNYHYTEQDKQQKIEDDNEWLALIASM